MEKTLAAKIGAALVCAFLIPALSSCGSSGDGSAGSDAEKLYLSDARAGFPESQQSQLKDSDLLDFGYGMCESVRQGGTFEDMITSIAENPNTSDDFKYTEGNMALSAILDLCPELRRAAGLPGAPAPPRPAAPAPATPRPGALAPTMLPAADRDLLAALDCQEPVPDQTLPEPRISYSCRDLQGQRLVYMFDSPGKRTAWLKRLRSYGGAGAFVIAGPRWAVVTTNRGMVDAAVAAGGSVVEGGSD